MHLRCRPFVLFTVGFLSLLQSQVVHGNDALIITRDALCDGRITNLQCGQFIEYLCNLVPGMWAEKLYDGSFEGLSPYKFVFIRQTDFRENPWYPSGQMNRATYSLDPRHAVSGSVAQKIEVVKDTPCTVGLSQDGLFIDRGEPLVFSCYLRQEGIHGPVSVRLHHESTGYASCEFKPTGEWQKFRAELLPSARDDRATLSITFHGPGTLWLDNASLMLRQTAGGWRPDVLRALRDLHPGVIRFGGSALDDPNLGDFDWRDTIGDVDHRKPFRAWGGLQPTGPGLEEIVQLMRAAGAEPLICVRTRQRTAKDAADEVQYFNGAADTPMGKLRAANGHPEPYHIRYWQVGNEQGGEEYERRLPDFCKAMKQADPNVELLASYPSVGVLQNAGQWLSYVSPHHYDCGNLPATIEQMNAARALLREHSQGRNIRLAVTEWNTTAGDAGPTRAKLWSLENALACSRYHNLLHRNCDVVAIACRSNLCNSFCSGIIQTDNHRLFKTPTYYAQFLYSTLADEHPLKLEPAFSPGDPLDCSATLSAVGKTLTLFAVNSTEQDLSRTIDLSAFGSVGTESSVSTLEDRQHVGEPDVANSFAEAERVAIATKTIKFMSPRIPYRFPRLSLTVMRWTVGGA
jgi:alpha-N-arabinofuranosidase